MSNSEEVITVPIPMPAWILDHLYQAITELKQFPRESAATLLGALLSDEFTSTIEYNTVSYLLDFHYGENYRKDILVLLEKCAITNGNTSQSASSTLIKELSDLREKNRVEYSNVTSIN